MTAWCILNKMCKKKITYTCTRVWTFTNSPRYWVICLLYEKFDVQHICISDEIKFYISENDVVLTEGNNGYILPKYFKKAYKIISSKHLCIWFSILWNLFILSGSFISLILKIKEGYLKSIYMYLHEAEWKK